jgi:hypothetical protein
MKKFFVVAQLMAAVLASSSFAPSVEANNGAGQKTHLRAGTHR